MDHKVSKDMISSGMTPSGEKSQEDLGRTQYGSAPSPSKLMDAYKSIYEHHQKDKDGNTIPHEGEELNEGKIPAGLQAYLDKKKGKKEDKKEVKEENVDEAIVTGSILGGLALKKLIGGAALKFGGKALAKKALMTMAGKTGLGKGAKIAGTGLNTYTTGSIVKQSLTPPPTVAPQRVTKPKMNRRTAGTGANVQFADVDLFDIVKGEIIAEGYNEKEAAQIMIELSKEEYKESLEQAVNEMLNEISLMPSTLAGAVTRGAAVSGGLLAARQVGKKVKQKVDDAINKARDNSPIGGNTRPGADKMYFGK